MHRIYAFFLIAAFASTASAQPPKAADARLTVELFASSPDIVHPVACDFDAKGRLLVVESHTHFAPKDYKGPKTDRIRVLEDTDGDGKADRFTTFFEGTRHTMDIATHPDGSVYVATRNEIIRLRDTKGTGVADEKTRIVFLDTKGDYPHNGLSGLCFDSKGDLTFGMGENLGAAYKLIGSDGVAFAGQGDGGHVFHCTADGAKLRRIATGFWNPFGNCRDIYGRLYCVDSDPDQAPPCRMLHVVEGGDYGFRFCYGRSGKHPFQSWHGTLPGTLPMMTGVGEAPCEILSYESDGLPAEYRGQHLVTAWADHRVERYQVKPHGASFKAKRLPFVQGGADFRPTGLAVAPDGSLFVGDWVKRDYTLHGKGAIWHVRAKDAKKPDRPSDPKEAIFSRHRPLREAAAKKLASDKVGREFLFDLIKQGTIGLISSAALNALVDVNGISAQQLTDIVNLNSNVGIRETAARELVARREFAGWNKRRMPAGLQALAIQRVKPFGKDTDVDEDLVPDALMNSDPFMRHAVIRHMGLSGGPGAYLNIKRIKESELRLAAILAERHRKNQVPNADRMSYYLNDPDETIRFLAVKWIADEKLADYREHVSKAMTDPKVSVRMYTAYATALARLDGRDVSETNLATYFVKRLEDDSAAPALRAQLLKQVPTTHNRMTVDLLAKLVKSDDASLKFEAVRALVDHPNTNRAVPLLDVFRNPKLDTSMRAFAMLGLSSPTKEMVAFAKDKSSPLHHDAIRSLIGTKLNMHAPEKDRPPVKDLDAWMKRLEGPADADAGARIFSHPKLAACYKCHRIDGRGADVGPDLSSIGRTDRRHLLESILQPSNTVAPHYVNWHLETADGKVKTGMLIHTNLDEYTYLDAQGGRFTLKTGNLAEQRALTTSVMPDGLVERMTDQEMRDLLAYLQGRK
jgi:putative membrane-bound dehydrogenase-like protein